LIALGIVGVGIIGFLLGAAMIAAGVLETKTSREIKACGYDAKHYTDEKEAQ